MNPLQSPVSQLELVTRGRPKAKFYLIAIWLFWLIWTPLTACVLTLFFVSWDIFFFCWLAFGFLGVVAIPLSTWQEMNASYLLTALPEGLEVVQPRRWRWGGRRQVAPRDTKLRLFLGHYDEESVVTLNIVWHKHMFVSRIMLAPFASPNVQAEFFDQMAAFLRENAFDFDPDKQYPR